jgi:hypothetical protein
MPKGPSRPSPQARRGGTDGAGTRNEAKRAGPKQKTNADAAKQPGGQELRKLIALPSRTALYDCGRVGRTLRYMLGLVQPAVAKCNIQEEGGVAPLASIAAF